MHLRFINLLVFECEPRALRRARNIAIERWTSASAVLSISTTSVQITQADGKATNRSDTSGLN